ncbi:MAG: hypothetical protein K4571_02270 [Deltaproteobacteria bacterium]
MSDNEEQSSVVDAYGLITRPSSCSLRIERAGIRILKEIVLTQYILHTQCGNTAGAAKTLSSRITHTWVKEGAAGHYWGA